MHDTAYETGGLFFKYYWQENYRNILEIGSMNVNGSLRDFCPDGATYIGVDLEAGNGVDVVVDDPTQLPFNSQSFDVIVSSSCFEHDKLFWVTFLELCRLLRPGGVLYVNAPSNGLFHRYPLDCWRFYPDAGDALAQWAVRNGIPLRLVESFVGGRKADIWNDCVMVFSNDNLPTAGLHAKLSFPTWNIRRPDLPDILAETTESEDMILLRDARRQLAERPKEDATPAAAATAADGSVKTWLHVTCGRQQPDAPPFDTAVWREVPVHLAPQAKVNLGTIGSGSVDAVYAVHNLQLLPMDQISMALGEFRRVLKPEGFLVFACPDLQSICAAVAGDRPDQPAYLSADGPVTPLDLLFGGGAHRTGFTQATLNAALCAAGFAGVQGLRREKLFDLWVVAGTSSLSEEQRAALAQRFFPM